MFRFYFSFLLMLFFCSCSHTISNAELKDDNKAIIITNLYYCSNNCRDHYSVNENVWYRYESDKKIDRKISFNNALTAFSVIPGIYYLDKYRIDYNEYANISSPTKSETGFEKWVENLINKNSKTLHKYIKFQAQPGEIVYIGDIEFNIHGDDSLTISVKDNYQNAVKYFNEKYKDNKKIIIKNLAEKLVPVEDK